MAPFEQTTSTAPAGDSSPPEFVEAYTRRLQEIQAVAESDIEPVNIDVRAAVTTVLGALPEMMTLRDQIATLSQIDQNAIDGLRDYAMAVGHANSICDTAFTPHDDVAALSDQAMRLRDVLKADAIALTTRGLIDPVRIAQLKGAPGYKNLAFELMDYANLLSGVWPEIQGKTALQPSEIDHARKLSERIVFALGQREQAPVVVADATRVRDQAFTLFVNAYSEARRAIQFLRYREDDADTIAPSLYAGRGGRGKSANDGSDAGTGGAADPVLPAGTPAAVTAPSASRASTVASSAPAQPIAPGMPGASPFLTRN